MSDNPQGLRTDRLSATLKAHADTTGGVMVGDTLTVDGYTVAIGEVSESGEISIRVTPPPSPVGDRTRTTGFSIRGGLSSER